MTGGANAGRSLVFCPGLLCDDALWNYQVSQLSRDFDITIADFSDCESIGSMAEKALAVAPARFALAALSMGGYVAQEIMRRAPDRVERLALLDTSARPDTAIQTARRRDLIELARKGRFRGVTPKLLPLLIHPRRLEEARLCADIEAMAERAGRDTFLRHQAAIMNRVDGRDDLAAIMVPTLVLCGREDLLTPLDAHVEMATAIPQSDLVVLGNCGHMSPMERPEAVTSALRSWLSA